ncbi:class I SAM-dependent methyltransferase [Kibdelosporangium persicum]|uniref:class I SAM-dependent methyltransferase n=1 Tax=Kibdelosporangium persicum TaxID=2698649 RepID=UPI001565772C|nr:class I SAM-dependent methyltransferase [Kibdelosporangium persicum]
MIYEHPLAYVLGLEGVALLQGFIGEHDREFVDARLAEIRELLADERLTQPVEVTQVSTVDGYRTWSARYDEPDNAAFAVDIPIVTGILDDLPVGVALDAACGTGRYAELLAERGHRVIGVDSSPDMLALARKRLPGSDFRQGDLHSLPVGEEVDVITCGLALTHNRDLGPIFAEFARVLKPGGHLVIADIHPDGVLRGSIPTVRGPNNEPARLVTYRHSIGDYLRAALQAGLVLRRCDEPRATGGPQPKGTEIGPWDVWPWSLAALVPEAAHAAAGPQLVVWHFQADTLRTM